MRIRQTDPNTTANYSELQRQCEHEVGSSGAASDRSRWGSRPPKALRGCLAKRRGESLARLVCIGISWTFMDLHGPPLASVCKHRCARLYSASIGQMRSGDQ